MLVYQGQIIAKYTWLVTIAMFHMKYRMIKDMVATFKCLFYVSTEIENDQYTLIEQSIH